jgi:hypothetical protein
MTELSRKDLNDAAPGLYLLRRERKEGEVICGPEGVNLRITGRLLARIRNTSELPDGAYAAWNRSDGKAVVIIRESTESP